MYTVIEVPQLLRLHPVTVWNLLRQGKIKGVKLTARGWRVSDEALRHFGTGGGKMSAEKADVVY